MDIGAFLKSKRNQANLSLSQVGDILGYSSQAVYSWESNKALPELAVWSKYANILGLDLESFLRCQDSKLNNRCEELKFDSDKFVNGLVVSRKTRHLTQKDVAKKLGINHKTVSSWERGVTSPSMKNFLVLCEIYKTSIDSLYFAIPEQNSSKKTKKRKFLPIFLPIIIVVGAGGGAATAIGVSEYKKKQATLNNSTENNSQINENSSPVSSTSTEHIVQHDIQDNWLYNDEIHWHACNDCDELFDVGSHVLSTTIINPTYESDGTKTESCNYCDYEKVTVLKQLEHHYADSYTYDNYYHWRECIDDGYSHLQSDYSAHSFTCDDDGNGTLTYTCECGFSYVDNTLSYIQYCLNVTSSNVNNGTVEILEGTGFAPENTRVLATPLNDNVFVGWYYGSELVSEEAEYDFVMPYHDYELTAVFASPEALKGEVPFVNPATQTVVFGSYPQQFVEDETVATALSGLSGSDVSGTILEYDENGDSILEKYYVSEVKKSRLTESGQTMAGGIGYFKIQPLVWKILETSENTYTIMADKVIDGTCWRKPVGEQLINNYEYSDIRSYINSNFINLAFNSTQQELINVTHVDNSINTTSCTTDQCICGDTDDKVFLLSYRDIQEKLWNTDSLIGFTTDFARAQNVEMSALDDSYGLAYWGSRSPDPSHLNVSVVTPFGRLEGYKYAYDYICGVRPAINITLS